MLKRWIVIVLLGMLVSTGIASAQDGGSTLQAWADTPASAINLSTQVESPRNTMIFRNINTYTVTGELVPSCVTSHSYSIWTTFVAPQSGAITLSLTQSNFNTDVFMAVYKTSVTAANEIRCMDDIHPATAFGEELYFNMVAGTRYYVMLAAAGTGTGIDSNTTFTFESVTNAFLYQPFKIPASGSYSNIQLNIENASATPASTGMCSAANHFVYYSFKPATSGRYEFSTAGSSYDTVLFLADSAVFACNEDINASNVNSRLRPTLTAGTTYLVLIGQTINAEDPQTDDMVLSLRVRRL